MIIIDGDQGEGGGQILRTSLALSLVTGQPFRIDQLRARRRRSGLQPQHLMCVHAAAAIGNAKTLGANIGSLGLTFFPQTITAGHYRFDIGTAGSTALVVQAVLPALMLANGPSTLVLTGGTHNPLAPTYDFLRHSFLPILRRMGPQVATELERAGYYPKGGGRIKVRIKPVSHLTALDLVDRGPVRNITAVATVVGLPRHIAERELGVIGHALGLRPAQLQIRVENADRGPANVVTIKVECAHVSEIFTAFGKRGLRAERVADACAAAADRYRRSQAATAEYLADQLLLPMALAGRGALTTLRPTLHTLTNRDIIHQFLGTSIVLTPLEDDLWRIHC
ncbi:MAG: RNA 3'-terminal phosphate cyclase [Gammaproteobacteria bacterium]